MADINEVYKRVSARSNNCDGVFHPKTVYSKETTDSKSCWYCHIENTVGGNFVTRKSSDPVPDEIRRLQEKMDFQPGEPVTKENFNKVIPSWVYRGQRQSNGNVRKIFHRNNRPLVRPQVTSTPVVNTSAHPVPVANSSAPSVN